VEENIQSALKNIFQEIFSNKNLKVKEKILESLLNFIKESEK
jgi:hypothetical protein